MSSPSNESVLNFDEPKRGRKWRVLVLIFGCWTVACLLYSVHLYLYHATRGRETTWLFQFSEALAAGYTWALLTPALFSFSAKFPLFISSFRRSLAHLPMAVLASSLQVLLHALADTFLIHREFTIQFLFSRIDRLFSRTFFFGLIVYAILAVLRSSFEYYRRRELNELQTQIELSQTQMKILRDQLEPHFLFNTLNTVSSLVYSNPKMAHKMISRLSQLLRASLTERPNQLVPLQRELELVRAYLEIETIRFEDRLSVEYRVPANLNDAVVPCLILQPLVENSIKHGIESEKRKGSIWIAASQDSDILQLTITDDGGGIAARDSKNTDGIGWRNIRDRLSHLYGEEAEFLTSNLNRGGAEVTIRIPLRWS